MKTLTVLYDSECAFCMRCRHWLAAQPAFIPIELLPRDTLNLESRFPGITPYLAPGGFVAITDSGDVYSGPDAFIISLHAIVETREWTYRLAHPSVRPFARDAFAMMSENRHLLFHWLKTCEPEDLAGFLRLASIAMPCRTP